MSGNYEGRHRPTPVRPQGRHRAVATKSQFRRVGVPAGVAVVATVGGAMVAGVTPLPVGGRTLAIDPGPYDSSSASTIKANAAKPTPVITPKRALPGGVSRDRTVERPKPKPTTGKTAKKTPSKPKPSSSPTPHESPWTCAVAACQGRMTSGFGPRVSPGGIGSTYHEGDDFAVAWGTPLLAMHTGTVVSAGWVPGLGNHVTIDYGDGVQSVYGHMSRIQVVPGQWLGRGQLVGQSGDTGNSTGPHLHLEIHLGGVPVNPAPWLQARGIF
ncbi:M23 family metallopeptidase [Flexivirga endophytica]|nr:M23 family metallopeptidase [Flexivirga endophytica]